MRGKLRPRPKTAPRLAGKPALSFDLAIARTVRAISTSRRIKTAPRNAGLLLLQFVNRREYQRSGELRFWPAQATLAAIAGRHQNVVGTAIRSLERDGVIRCIRRGGKSQGPSKYRFEPDWIDMTERELDAAGVLELWPDRRLPRPAIHAKRIRSQSNENIGLKRPLSIQRKRWIESNENVGLSPMKTLDDLTETPRMNYPTEVRDARPRAAPVFPPRRKPIVRGINGAAAYPKKPKSHQQRLADLRAFAPSPETVAFASEHCADVADPCGSHHLAKYTEWCVANDRIPADADAGFRTWLLREQEFAQKDKIQRKAGSTGERLMAAALHEVEKARYGR